MIRSLLDRWLRKPSASFVTRYIRNHPDAVSVTLMRNGEKLFSRNEDVPMPLASTVKIIVAVAYAKQAAKDTVNPQEAVGLDILARYYLPGLDGNAHADWLRHVQQKGAAEGGRVSLEEVAAGMIRFSSNANTEYLMERLGFDTLDRTLRELGLNDHEPLHPFVASLLIPYELGLQGGGLTTKEARSSVKEQIRRMTLNEYQALALRIHEKLREDADGSYKRAADILSWYDQDFDILNSDRFIKGTTAEYAEIMRKINSRAFFDDKTQHHLTRLLEGLMENPRNQAWLRHAGRKGGSTAYVLTEAMYAADKEGNQTEMALFFKDLDPLDRMRLSAGLNAFTLNILTDAEFRKSLGG